jgi:E3 ubiquitin-protein ligase HUWE1
LFVGDLPEGVDPSFLAALPENIRQEVIAEQLRLQRIQARAQQQQQQSAETPGVMEVNPEFLAALPPNIQEEVSSGFTTVVLGVQLSVCKYFA